jgi:hypothetical protein
LLRANTGLVKAFLDTVYKWLASANKATSAGKLWARRLDALRSVKWIVARSISKTGSWVSENYLAWARLLRWFFSDLQLAVPESVYIAPDRAFGEYTKKMNENYLRACGVDPSTWADMVPDELKLHVAELRASDNPPTIDSSAVTAADVQVAASLLNALLARAMQAIASDALAADVEAHVKAYLTALNTIDAGHRGERKPVWSSRANHLTALNAGEAMRQNGAVNRACWGGGFIGERAVAEMRSNTGSLQGAWSHRAVHSVYVGRAARLLEPRRTPEPHSSVKVLPGGAAAVLEALPSHVQLVRVGGSFGIVVARDRGAATVTLEPVAPVPGTLVEAACGVAFWEWAPVAGDRAVVAEVDLEHWVLLAAHSGAGKGYYACGDAWCEVGCDRQPSMAPVFAAVTAAGAAREAGGAAAAASLVDSSAEREVERAAAAGVHAQKVSAALTQLHNSGLSLLSGVKCQLLARALFKETLKGKKSELIEGLRKLLVAAAPEFIADRLDLAEGLKFEMVFADNPGPFAAEVVEVRGGDMYGCSYADGDNMVHSGDQLRIALQQQPLHMR